MANGKGDKHRVRWSKTFEKRFNLIFNKTRRNKNG